MENGTVKFFNTDRGYGFIEPDAGGSDMFFHVSQIADGIKLREGDRVQFEIGESRGKPAAQRVAVL